MYRWPPDTTNQDGSNWYPYQNDYNWYTWQMWYTLCQKCGGQVSSNDKFCPNCGAPLWIAETTDDKINRLEKKVEELLREVRSLSGKAKKEGNE